MTANNTNTSIVVYEHRAGRLARFVRAVGRFFYRRGGVTVDSVKSLAPSETVGSAGGRPVGQDIKAEQLQRRFDSNTWLYGAVRLRATSAATVSWTAGTVDADGQLTPLAPDHPLQRLLHRPNEHMTFHELLERSQQQLDLNGNAYLSKVRGTRNQVIELWPLPPGSCSPVPSKQPGVFIDGYEFQKGGRRRVLPPEDVMHIQYPDPDNLYVGMSPIQAALRVVDLDLKATEWNRWLVDNRAVPEMAVMFKAELSAKQYQHAVEKVAEAHMGAQNAGRPWVMDNSADIKTFGATPKEMDWIETRRFNREEIASIYSVPPPLLGIYDNATLANIETARKIFWQDTMIPLLSRWRQLLNLTLASEFGDNVRITFDLSHVEPLQAVLRQNIDAAAKLFAMGVPLATINERLAMDLPDMPGSDVSYLPNSVQPATFFASDPMIPGS